MHSYEHMAMQEEINKKFKSAFIYLEKTYKFVQHYYGNSSKLKLFEMNIRNFKEVGKKKTNWFY